jgi:hypothetical protein
MVQMTEMEFWTKYFSSRYFHRSRLPGQVADEDDFFKDYINEDEDGCYAYKFSRGCKAK